MEIWESKPPGTLWATPGLLRDCFTMRIIKIDKDDGGAVTMTAVRAANYCRTN